MLPLSLPLWVLYGVIFRPVIVFGGEIDCVSYQACKGQVLTCANDGQTCIVTCGFDNGDNESCMNATINCQANQDCIVHCIQHRACESATINGNNALSLIVNTSDITQNDLLLNANINCNNVDFCRVSCKDSYRSCKGATINGQNAGTLAVTCEDTHGWQNCLMDITCPDTTPTCWIFGSFGSVSVNLYAAMGFNGVEICDNSITSGTMYCSSGQCSINNNQCGTPSPSPCDDTDSQVNMDCTINANTPIPTPQPTPVPTAIPTNKPTVVPTSVPTPIPTPVPTTNPTPIPTSTPTNIPITSTPTTKKPTNPPVTFEPTTNIPTNISPTSTPVTSIPSTHTPTTLSPISASTINTETSATAGESTSTLSTAKLPTVTSSTTTNPTPRPSNPNGMSSTQLVDGEVETTNNQADVHTTESLTSANNNSDSFPYVLVVVIIGVLTVVAVAIVIIYKLKKKKNNKQLSENMKKVVHSEMSSVRSGENNNRQQLPKQLPPAIPTIPVANITDVDIVYDEEKHDGMATPMQIEGDFNLSYPVIKLQSISTSTRTDEVRLWLTNNCHLAQYYDTFISNRYDSLFVISNIASKREIKNMGIGLVGHQSKIWSEVNKLKRRGTISNDVFNNDTPGSTSSDDEPGTITGTNSGNSSLYIIDEFDEKDKDDQQMHRRTSGGTGNRKMRANHNPHHSDDVIIGGHNINNGNYSTMINGKKVQTKTNDFDDDYYKFIHKNNNSKNNKNNSIKMNDKQILKQWLSDKCGFSKYYELFIQNGFDSLDMVVDIESRSLLGEMGIKLLGHQTKIWAQIKILKKNARKGATKSRAPLNQLLNDDDTNTSGTDTGGDDTTQSGTSGDVQNKKNFPYYD